MKTSHMGCFSTGASGVVREGEREFTAFDGSSYDMSLT